MLSFIIPAHNEEHLLPQAIETLVATANASGELYEIIVVNDSSDDATAALAQAHATQVINVDFRQIAATRNAGARAAKGDLLFFVDADTLIDPPALRASLAALRGGFDGGGVGVVLYGQPKRSERVAAWLISEYMCWAKIAPGCFLFCTRAAFERTGGFDESLFAIEDLAMSRALAATGPFVILREKVRTSDRKMRTHGLMAHVRLIGSLLFRGKSVLRSRTHLDLWYGKRRNSD